MTNREKIELHKTWWRRENNAPLQAHFAPIQLPFGGLDISVPVKEIGPRKQANAVVQATVAQDLLVVARVDFGPAFLPALAGAGFQHDGHTSWNIPIAERCADVTIPDFTPDNPLWIAYTERREQMLAHWSWEGYLPGHASNVGPLDIVAGLLGPENLALEMYEDPAGVLELALAAADLLAAVMREDLAALRARGPADGTTELYSIWLPGNGVRFVEDFTALIGPKQTREFVLPASRRATQGFDSILYHTHSAAWRNLPIMAEIGGNVAIEFGTDPGGPDLATRIVAARQVQELGLPLQYGSWNHRLSDVEIDQVVTGLDPRGLILRFQTESCAEAAKLYDRIASKGE